MDRIKKDKSGKLWLILHGLVSNKLISAQTYEDLQRTVLEGVEVQVPRMFYLQRVVGDICLSPDRHDWVLLIGRETYNGPFQVRDEHILHPLSSSVILMVVTTRYVACLQP